MADGGETEPGGGEPPAEAQSRKYDQAFFLDLAAKGKEAWNAWRRDPANKDVYVTFADIDFSRAPRDAINFAGIEFGRGANFSGCRWRGVEWFEIRPNPKAFAPGRAFFPNAVVGDETNFTAATFGNYVDFSRAAFGHVVNFDGAAFGDLADFSRVVFGDYAIFTNAVFGFDGGAVFNGRVEFIGESKDQRAGDFASMDVGEGPARHSKNGIRSLTLDLTVS